MRHITISLALAALPLLAQQAKISSGPLAAIASIPLDYAGYGIVALFVIVWLIALAVWRFGRIEEKWAARLSVPGAGD